MALHQHLHFYSISPAIHPALPVCPLRGCLDPVLPRTLAHFALTHAFVPYLFVCAPRPSSRTRLQPLVSTGSAATRGNVAPRSQERAGGATESRGIDSDSYSDTFVLSEGETPLKGSTPLTATTPAKIAAGDSSFAGPAALGMARETRYA